MKYKIIGHSGCMQSLDIASTRPIKKLYYLAMGPQAYFITLTVPERISSCEFIAITNRSRA